MAKTDHSSDDKALALGVFMGCFTSRELVRSCDPMTETSFKDIIMPGNCNKIKVTAKEDLQLNFLLIIFYVQ
jgi:hypothetical protein